MCEYYKPGPVLIQPKTPNKCLVPNCENQTGLFHQIPSDEIRRRIWISLLGMQEYQLTGSWKQIKVCQAHFTPDSYQDLNLKNDANPTLHVPCPLIPLCGKKGLKDKQGFKVRNMAFGLFATPKAHLCVCSSILGTL